jgi:predicted nuclease of predicted toxin-antitoxin system
MKILLDECLDWRLLRDLAGFDAKTVRQMGWLEIQNGALLSLAESAFDVFVTVDKKLSFQQNLKARRIAIVVLGGISTDIHHLRLLIPQLLRELPNLRPGTVLTIEPP